MAELIDFEQAGTGVIAKRLLLVTEQLAQTLRETLLSQLRHLQAYNILDLTPELQVKAIAAVRNVKAMIAETYPDVHQRLADIAVQTGQPVSNEQAAQLCRELHPECFEVRIT